MSWIQNALTEPSIVQTLIFICFVGLVGTLLGKLKFFGLSLGITFVFFVGILVGHFNTPMNKDMLHFAQNFGLIVFIYMLGLQVGPGFFSSMKKGGLKLNLLALAVVIFGLGMALSFHTLFNISLPRMMGLLAGAVTNTPALGAAQQVVKQFRPDDPQTISDMASACAITYPMGVVGVILAIIFLKKLAPKQHAQQTNKEADSTFVGEYTISNPAIMNRSILDIMAHSTKKCIISRVWRNGVVTIPTSETILQDHDHLLVICKKTDIISIRTLFGEQEAVDWNKEDIDWNHVDNSHLISRRIIVTKSKINGVKLGSLKLRNHYGINITRVNRIGMDLLPSPDLSLQIGDRITVVGEAASVESVISILGDEMKRLDEPNLISIFLGIFLGLIFGSLPFPLPGMSMPVRLGIAGGPIIIGILMGAFGPRLKITTYTTQSANSLLRQLGLVMYLACLGLDAGSHFFETIFEGNGLLWIGLGFVLTTVPVTLVGALSLKAFKLNFGSAVGMLCGSMANPIALNYVNSTIEGDEPAVCYATVYPMVTFIHIIAAQLILMILL